MTADINNAFNASEHLGEQLRQMNVCVGRELVAIELLQVNCHLLEEGKIALQAEVLLVKTREKQQVSFTATPRISPDRQGVVLQNIDYASGQELSLELTAALVDKASEILNLNNFELEGMVLWVQQLHLELGKLKLEAEAYIEQFPAT